MSKIHKHVWPGLAAGVSLCFSAVTLATGIVVGYLATRLFMKKYVDTGKVGSVFVPLGSWRLHLHHWIMGVLVLVAIPIIGSYHECPKILLGVVGGVIAEDFEDAYSPVVAWLGAQKARFKI